MQYTILIVDDEPANLRMVERLLRRDYQVLTATSGEEALEILAREAVDLIITDQRMPGMSGTELLRESMQTNPDATRIILTGFTDIESLIEAINTTQVYKFVSKPWDPVNLKSTIDYALHEHQKQADMKKFVGDLAKLVQSYPNLFIDRADHLEAPVGKSVTSVQQ
jgi:two-component system, sensor histidine kinase and response regulator